MPGAFVAAGFADFRANPADLLGEFAVPRHVTGGEPTDACTVDVERDAARHHLPSGPAPINPAQCRSMKIFVLFVATALAEIVGCYLPYLWLRQGRSVWLLLPAAVSLALFAWLLSLHETAAGRLYAAYGGVYIGVALVWLWGVDGVRPTLWDLAGAAVALAGMGIIMFQPR